MHIVMVYLRSNLTAVERLVLRSEIATAMTGIDRLSIKSEADMTVVLTIDDNRLQGLHDDILVELYLGDQPITMASDKKAPAEIVGAAITVFFPHASIECWSYSFNSEQECWEPTPDVVFRNQPIYTRPHVRQLSEIASDPQFRRGFEDGRAGRKKDGGSSLYLDGYEQGKLRRPHSSAGARLDIT